MDVQLPVGCMGLKIKFGWHCCVGGNRNHMGMMVHRWCVREAAGQGEDSEKARDGKERSEK